MSKLTVFVKFEKHRAAVAATAHGVIVGHTPSQQQLTAEEGSRRLFDVFLVVPVQLGHLEHVRNHLRLAEPEIINLTSARVLPHRRLELCTLVHEHFTAWPSHINELLDARCAGRNHDEPHAQLIKFRTSGAEQLGGL